MVKLTKGQIETKLATLVTNNDHEQLELFVAANPDANINGVISKKKQGLLSLAIENRCKECFDWLLANGNYTAIGNKPDDKFNFPSSNFYVLHQEYENLNPVAQPEPDDSDEDDNSDDSDEEDNLDNDEVDDINSYEYDGIVGTSKAIEMYTRAPNLANGYYLSRLIEAQVFFSPENLIKLENFPQMYGLACGSIMFTHDYLCTLLEKQILTNSSKASKTFDKLKPNLTPIQLSYFVKQTLANSSNFQFLKYLLDIYGSKIKLIEYTKPTDILTFTLLMSYHNDTKLIPTFLDMILTQYKKEPVGDFFDAHMFVYNFITYFDYFKLNLTGNLWKQLDLTVDLGPHIKAYLQWDFHKEKKYYFDENFPIHQQYNLFMMLKFLWCKSNPWDFTDNEKVKLHSKNQIKNENKKTKAHEYKAKYEKHDELKNKYKSIAYVLIANGFEPTAYAKEAMELLDISYEDLVAKTPGYVKDFLPLTNTLDQIINPVSQPNKSSKSTKPNKSSQVKQAILTKAPKEPRVKTTQMEINL